MGGGGGMKRARGLKRKKRREEVENRRSKRGEIDDGPLSFYISPAFSLDSAADARRECLCELPASTTRKAEGQGRTEKRETSRQLGSVADQAFDLLERRRKKKLKLQLFFSFLFHFFVFYNQGAGKTLLSVLSHSLYLSLFCSLCLLL